MMASTAVAVVPSQPLEPLDRLAVEGHALIDKMVRGIEDLAEHRARFGMVLLEARGIIGHGGWERWVREQFDIGQSMAWKYMEAARQATENPNHYRDNDFGLNAVRKGRIELPTAPKARERQEPDDSPAGRMIAQAQSAAAGADPEPVEATVVDFDPPVPFAKTEQKLWDELHDRHAKIMVRIESTTVLNAAAAERQLVKASLEYRQLAADVQSLAEAAHRHA